MEEGQETPPELKEYSFSEMRDALWRLRRPFENITDFTYTDMADRNGIVDSQVRAGDLLTEYFQKQQPDDSDSPALFAYLQPSSEDRRIVMAYFGINEDMPWQEAAERIMYTVDHLGNLDAFESSDLVERTLQRMSTYKKLPVHTAEVTYRAYDQYISMFGIDDDLLKGKRILDLGSGLSSFTEEINQKFGNEGTVAIGLDPTYEILPDLKIDEQTDPRDAFKQFTDKLRKRSSSTVGYYGADRDTKDYTEEEVSLGERITSLKVNPDSQVIAAAGQNIPIADESMDLIFSSNYLFRDMKGTHPADKEGLTALTEAIRVLKENGQLFIRPIFRLHSMEQEGAEPVIMLFDQQKSTFDPTTESFKHHIDTDSLNGLRQLEELGAAFYFVIEADSWHELVIRKDGDQPEGLKDRDTCKVFRLRFAEHDTSDNPAIPATLLPA